ncbi:hypothetical protein [Caulobacter sp. UNC279MFTsu5.1]|uniref:hypothetical protein n=1 Tax=Caulobacter sp. UNC279MFTsu5.1 TaxID=1502775 RepID=UPI001160B278|nr:hypothetical protein [Caulobacter sp. UNC279MFTsu5.1]
MASVKMPVVALLVAAPALILANCAPPSDQIAASTRHCADVRVAADLSMRLSSYGEDNERWVVQACHPSGTACTRVLSYEHAPPPVYSMGDDETVTIEVLGGKLLAHVDEAATSRKFHFRAHKITGNMGAEGVKSFYARIQHRCPPPNRLYPR